MNRETALGFLVYMGVHNATRKPSLLVETAALESLEVVWNELPSRCRKSILSTIEYTQYQSIEGGPLLLNAQWIAFWDAKQGPEYPFTIDGKCRRCGATATIGKVRRYYCVPCGTSVGE